MYKRQNQATLLARLTAARAGYLDELAAANMPADLDNVLTDTGTTLPARFTGVEGERSEGLRARYKIRLRAGSAEVGGIVEVIEWDPPHELAWTSITGIDQRGRWILHEKGKNQTEAILRLGYQVPGGLMALVADRIGSRAVRRSLRDSLGGLKRMLEVK